MYFVKKAGNFINKALRSRRVNNLKSRVAFIGAVVSDAFRYIFKKLTLKVSRTAVIAGLLACFVSVASVCYAFEYNTAVAVFLNGKKIGYVRDTETADAVKNGVYSAVHGDIDAYAEITFSEELIYGEVSKAGDIVAGIVGSVDGIDSVCGLYVDGMLTAYAESSDDIVSMLDALIETYSGEGAVFKGYANHVEIKEAYITDDGTEGLVSSVEGFLDGRTGVQIITSRVENYDEEIPYYTHVTYDEGRTSGYVKVINEGENGISNVTADVIYINGNRAGADVITRQLVAAPVNANVKKGMCEEAIESIRVSYSYSSADSDAELFAFPCEITSRTYISSYWGDRRNHKGIDIASPKGSEIYAAADGVVSFVGWNGAYGNCVIIDHPDGKTQTLYAHNSKNIVSVGDEVTAGQVIAKVGSTGRSTGNHLHFSVLVNGKHVNPENYLGIYDK